MPLCMCSQRCALFIVLGRKPRDPRGEWWELFDDHHGLPYYYNTMTGETDWIRPDGATVIPLHALQNNKEAQRASKLVEKRASKIWYESGQAEKRLSMMGALGNNPGPSGMYQQQPQQYDYGQRTDSPFNGSVASGSQQAASMTSGRRNDSAAYQGTSMRQQTSVDSSNNPSQYVQQQQRLQENYENSAQVQQHPQSRASPPHQASYQEGYQNMQHQQQPHQYNHPQQQHQAYGSYGQQQGPDSYQQPPGNSLRPDNQNNMLNPNGVHRPMQRSMSDLSPRMEEERRMQMAQMGLDDGNELHGRKMSGQVTVNTQNYPSQGPYLAAQQPGMILCHA